jgi:2-methylaconitate cis-trans-isomerase PrpF
MAASTAGVSIASVTAPATSTTSAQIVGASGKRYRIVFNDSAGILYVLLGTGTASATSCTYKILAGASVSLEGFGGVMQGVLDTGTGVARVTEY